jgi:ankyrin repeat protein
MKIEADIIQELGRLPESLADLYALIYDQIFQSGPQSRLVADRVLKWLLCAQRPLRTDELVAAVSINSSGQCIRLSTTDLLNMCCNLVVLDAELDVFRFAHLSVREFLEGMDDYSISEIHALATERCINTLAVQLDSNHSLDLMGKLNDLFRPYATLYWPTHCRSSGSSQFVEDLNAKVIQFLLRGCEPAPPFVRWLSTAKEAVTLLPMDDPLRKALMLAFSSPPNALFLACSYGLTAVVEDMCGHNYRQWDQRNDNFDTGLHLAASGGHTRLVRLLLKEGAKANARDISRRTPLHRAAAGGHDLEVRELLLNGANADATDYTEATALYVAASHGHINVVRTLLQSRAKMEIESGYGWTALQQAADSGHVEIVRLLLEHGADIHSESSRGLTALHRAAGRGHNAILLMLLERGSAIEGKTLDEWTPLHGAASAGRESTIELLLNRGADIGARSLDQRTPLHRACRGRHELAVSMLISRGADVVARDEAGRIPLHDAAEKGSEAIVATLLQCDERLRGFQLEAKDFSGHTADRIANTAGQLEMARLLREQQSALSGKECEQPTKLDLAIEKGDISTAIHLIEQGADINSCGYDGLTPLHRAAWHNSEDITKIILSRGAHPEITTPDGWTPLHSAARAAREATVRILLNAGANILARTNDWQTPLHKSCQGGSEEIVQLLVDAGAPVGALDAKRRTPLHEAATYGHEAVTKLLIGYGVDVQARDNYGTTPQYAANLEGHHALAELLRRERAKLYR